MNLQPHQRASQEINRQSAAPLKAASAIVGTAGLAGGGAILSKILPFLNKYIPQDLAIKGISKVNPKIGKFIQTSINQGYPKDDVFSFLKDKAGIKGENFAKTDEEAQMDQPQAPQMPVAEQEAQRFQEYYGQKQNNQTDEALMAALNKILTM